MENKIPNFKKPYCPVCGHEFEFGEGSGKWEQHMIENGCINEPGFLSE